MIKEIIGYTTAITALPKVDSGPDTNGHEYIDLGLPSGTLWATMNVGATSPTEYGNYYMYGMGSKTYDSTDTPYDGTEDPLDLSKDTARVVWGGDWHMPTKTQIEELLTNTTYAWVTDYQSSSVNGGTFTANGQTLFIPANGDYYLGGLSDDGVYGNVWSSTPNDIVSAQSFCLENGDNGTYPESRRHGYSVRPVIG